MIYILSKAKLLFILKFQTMNIIYIREQSLKINCYRQATSKKIICLAQILLELAKSSHQIKFILITLDGIS